MKRNTKKRGSSIPGITRPVDNNRYYKSLEHETTAEVYDAAARLYQDIFPEQHPFEMANQPAIVNRLQDGIMGL
jgi:hypothetical protein